MALSKGKVKKEELPELRIILIGKTGAGKSYLGNALLGRDEFLSSITASSVTFSCAFGKQEITSGSRKYMLKVIDTPGLVDNRIPKTATCFELVKSLSLTLPGPHLFCIVVKIGRFTKEDQDVVEMLKGEFGDELMNFALVVFTHGSSLRGMSIEDFLETAPPPLKQVVEECQNRYAVIYDYDQNQESVQNIIDLIVRSVELRYYTNDMFKQADTNKKRIIAKLEEDKHRKILILEEEVRELKRKAIESRSEEEKRKLKEKKDRKKRKLKKTRITSSQHTYDVKVVAPNNSTARDTFAGSVSKVVCGIIATGVGVFTSNAVVALNGMMTVAKSVTSLAYNSHADDESSENESLDDESLDDEEFSDDEFSDEFSDESSEKNDIDLMHF